MDKIKKFCLKKKVQFLKSNYFKSLINLKWKHVYSSLSDVSFYLMFSVLTILFSVLMEILFTNFNPNLILSEEILLPIYLSTLKKSLFLILLYAFLLVGLFSLSRFAVYSFLEEKWHGWKNYFKYFAFNLSFFVSMIILLLLGNYMFKDSIVGFFGLILLVVMFYFLLAFNLIYFNKPNIFSSLRKAFSLGFGFLGRVVLSFFTLIIVSFIITLFIQLLHLLNFSNNLLTMQIISVINYILLVPIILILIALLRNYLLDYVKHLK
jgi:hypothetical protein